MQTLLIIEDDTSLRKLYAQEFTDEGYRVLTAANSREAMEVLERDMPDAAILDLVMPGTDGIELLQRFVKQVPHLAVVINTAYPVYRHNYLTWSADAYVVKSSDLTELKQTVRSVLIKRRNETGD
jgi:DNA-binding response OmpR family regulator